MCCVRCGFTQGHCTSVDAVFKPHHLENNTYNWSSHCDVLESESGKRLKVHCLVLSNFDKINFALHSDFVHVHTRIYERDDYYI